MLGIDIGNRSIKLIKLDVVDSTPVVSAFGWVALPEGVAPPGGAIDGPKLSAKLNEVLRLAGTSGGEAVFSVPVTEAAAFERIRFAALAPEELLAGPLWSELDARVRFPVDHENVALAFDPPELGAQVTVSVACLPHATVQAYEQVVRGVGLAPLGCTLDGLAWAAWLHYRGFGADEPVTGVHVGSCTTSIITLHRDVVRSLRWIPLGGEDVTRALMERLSIDREAAERLKRGIGGAGRHALGYRVQHSRVDRAAAELVEGIAARHADAIVEVLDENPGGLAIAPRVILAGGGARLGQLEAALRRRCPEPVERDCGADGVMLGPNVDEAGFSAHRSDLGPLLGLALGQALSIALGTSRDSIPRSRRRNIPAPRPAPFPPAAAADPFLAPLFNGRPSRGQVQAHLLALVLGLVFGSGFLLAAAGLLAAYVDHAVFAAEASPAKGVVVDHKWIRGSKKNTSRCCALIEFEVQGRTHQFLETSCHTTCQPGKGAPVDVLYRRSDEADARAAVDVRPLPYLAGVLGPLGIAGCVLGVVAYRRGKRKGGACIAL